MTTLRRSVLVTGGSGQLGRAVVSRFAAGGDAVFIGYCNGEARARAIVDEVVANGGTAYPLQFDLASEESVGEAFAEIERIAGGIDILVNNAAYRPIGGFLELSDAEWTDVIGANLLGAVRCSRRALPRMAERRWGRIINISGLDAIWGWGNRAHVTVSKAGLSGLTRAIAVEFAEQGITANTLVLGTFEVERDPAGYPNWEVSRDFLLSRTLVGRTGRPDEMAEWCWLIASEAGAWMTGQDVHLNGGAYPLVRNPLVGASNVEAE